MDQNAKLARFDEDFAQTLQVLGQIYAFVGGLFEFMIYESIVSLFVVGNSVGRRRRSRSTHADQKRRSRITHASAVRSGQGKRAIPNSVWFF